MRGFKELTVHQDKAVAWFYQVVLVILLLCLHTIHTAAAHLKDLSGGLINEDLLEKHPGEHHHHRHHHRNDLEDNHVTCPEGHFQQILSTGSHRCVPCSKCPEGFGVQRECGLQSDTQCTQCVAGQEYLREYFGMKKCLPCTRCENRKVISECSATEDRICSKSCNHGYFPGDFGECLRCSYCYPEVPGYGVIEPMCQTETWPREMTCLPSLPPNCLRKKLVTEQHDLPGRKFQLLDDKLKRLNTFLSVELQEVRNELKGMTRTIRQRD